MSISYEELARRALLGKEMFTSAYVLEKVNCLQKTTYYISKNIDGSRLQRLEKSFDMEEEARDFARENNLLLDDCIAEQNILV